MDNSIIFRKYLDLLESIGKQGLNALYPKEFEVHMMSLELTTSDGKLIDYLSFPVLPDSYSQTEGLRVNVKKTLNGVSIITSKSFTPKLVTMSGTFGKSFKFLNSPSKPFEALSFSTRAGVYSSLDTNPRTPKINFPNFDVSIRSGFGVMKILQAIINKSTSLDALGKPFKLFFHNPTMGESYLAIPTQNALVINQGLDKNTLHSYTLNLNLIMPIDYLKNKLSATSIGTRLASNNIQQGVNLLSNEIRRSL